MVRVGLVGCGTIGSRLALSIQRHHRGRARIVALHDTDAAAAQRLRRALRSHPPVVSLQEVIRRSDLVIEAAGAGISGALAAGVLSKGKDILVMSVGGLLMDERWRKAARRSKGRLHVPSGALAGLDGVRAMARTGIRRVVLTTRKPPRALMGSPYVKERRIRLTGLKRARVLFQGGADKVVRAFPQNTNVAAALALASGRPASSVRVRVVADPGLSHNVHAYTVEGAAGRLECVIESIPSANPKTSEMAVLSAEAALSRLFESVVIGS